MQVLCTPHAVDQDHLAKVVADMQRLGAATIRVVDCGDFLMALEGTHRVAAAAKLGTPLQMVVLDQADMVAADSLDWQDLQLGQTYTAGELAGEVYTPSCGVYWIEKSGTVRAA